MRGTAMVGGCLLSAGRGVRLMTWVVCRLLGWCWCAAGVNTFFSAPCILAMAGKGESTPLTRPSPQIKLLVRRRRALRRCSCPPASPCCLALPLARAARWRAAAPPAPT